MHSERCLSVVVVGVGPRGLSVLERLLAHLESGPVLATGLQITVIDPAGFGHGAVWDPAQPTELLMNTTAGFTSAVPSGATLTALRGSSASLSFLEWLGTNSDPTEYAPRATYGKYLASVYARVRSGLLAQSSVKSFREVHDRAAAVTPLLPVGYSVVLESGETVAGEAVVLCLGHQPCRLSAAQRDLAAFADRTGATYVGPSLPADVPVDRVPSQTPVLLRGMGLNFFDLVARMTLGRGGHFIRGLGNAGERGLTYRRSGHEPIIFALSRRGLPYHGKGTYRAQSLTGESLRYFVSERLPFPKPGGYDFRSDLWPLIYRDMLWRAIQTPRYSLTTTTVTALQEVFDDTTLTLAEIDGHVTQTVETQGGHHPWHEEAKLTRPFHRRVFPTDEAYKRSVHAWLVADIESATDSDNSARGAGFSALFASRYLTETLLGQERIQRRSASSDVMQWYFALLHSLTAGPPVRRIEQLLALGQAGIVRFIGPEPDIDIDEALGEYVIRSPQVASITFRTRILIEASSPPNDLERHDSALLRQLLSDGVLSRDHFPSDSGSPVLAGLRLDPFSWRALDAQGERQPGLFVLGLQQAGYRFGTAIAPQAGGKVDGNCRTLADADTIVRNILGMSGGSFCEQADHYADTASPV